MSSHGRSFDSAHDICLCADVQPSESRSSLTFWLIVKSVVKTGMLKFWILTGRRADITPFINLAIDWPSGAHAHSVMVSEHDTMLLQMEFDLTLHEGHRCFCYDGINRIVFSQEHCCVATLCQRRCMHLS